MFFHIRVMQIFTRHGLWAHKTCVMFCCKWIGNSIEQIYKWVRSWNCDCPVTWFCYQLIAKPGNRTTTVPWPDPYTLHCFTAFVLLLKKVINALRFCVIPLSQLLSDSHSCMSILWTHTCCLQNMTDQTIALKCSNGSLDMTISLTPYGLVPHIQQFPHLMSASIGFIWHIL